MSTGFLLDTSTCIEILRRRTRGLRERLTREQAPLHISTVVLMELAVGPIKTADAERGALLDAFVARLSVLDYDISAARHTADIRADLERRGTPIGPYDYQIAGHARSQGLTVVTCNMREFSRVDGLRVENWLAAQGPHE